MLSRNNVIFGFQVAYEETPEDALIDTNFLADELIAKEERAYKAKLLEEERARRLAELEENGGEIPEGMEPEEFLNLADTIMGEEPVEDEPQIDYVAEAKAQADEILMAANEEANNIIMDAQINAEALKNLARQDGEKDGYNEGTQKAAIELQHAREEMDAELERIRQEFLQKELDMEHEIVDLCMGVFEKVFNAQLEGKKDVLFHLLDNCLMNIEPSRQMQVKVSETNAEFIKSKKEEILTRVGSDVVIDVISDPLLNDSQCIIETDGGLFDCSIDTELDQLIREIKSLS